MKKKNILVKKKGYLVNLQESIWWNGYCRSGRGRWKFCEISFQRLIRYCGKFQNFSNL